MEIIFWEIWININGDSYKFIFAILGIVVEMKRENKIEVVNNFIKPR